MSHPANLPYEEPVRITKENAVWEKGFTFMIPIPVGKKEGGEPKFIFFGFYEFRKYFERDGWCTETRGKDKSQSYTMFPSSQPLDPQYQQ